MEKHSSRHRKVRQTPNPIAYLTQKNVKYISGIPRSISNIEKVYQLVIPSSFLSSSLTAGSIASSSTLDPLTRLDSFSTRWAAVFRQYCVTKIVVALSITNASSTPAGTIWAQIQENNSVPGSSSVGEERSVIYLNAPNDPSKNSACITWVPRSAEDLTWTDTATNLAICYLKIYGNTTNTLTSGGDSSTRVSAMIYYHIAFRYLL
jgi:hypothetical protein